MLRPEISSRGNAESSLTSRQTSGVPYVESRLHKDGAEHQALGIEPVELTIEDGAEATILMGHPMVQKEARFTEDTSLGLKVEDSVVVHVEEDGAAHVKGIRERAK